MSHRLRLGPVLTVLFSLVIGACHKSNRSSPLEGAFLGLDGGLMILIVGDDVVFINVLGEGTCIPIEEAKLDGNEILFGADPVFGVDATSTGITITDPSGLIDGAYARVPDVESICFTDVPEPGAMTAGTFEVTPGPARSISDGKARTAEITIGADVGTLAVYLIGPDVGWNGIAPRTFRSPSGSDLLLREPYLTECSDAACTVLLPKIPGVSPVAGTYTFDFGGPGDIDDVKVLVVTRPLPITDTTVHLHVVLGPTDHSMSEITNALTRVVDLYADYGITLVVDPVVQSNNPDFAVVPAAFLSPRTQALSMLGSADAINLFLVDDIEGIEGLLGLGSGIPGTLGVVGPWNGVLVSIQAHEVLSAATFTQVLAETIIHESGHLLGLYHTTESGGTVFDPLDDTEECPIASFDANLDGDVVADECETRGGDNVMFWTPAVNSPPLLEQTVLTPDQTSVLDHVVVGE